MDFLLILIFVAFRVYSWMISFFILQTKIAHCQNFAEIETEIVVFTNPKATEQINLQILCQKF